MAGIVAQQALVAVVALLSATAVGALLTSERFEHGGAAAHRAQDVSPGPSPSTVGAFKYQLSAPSPNVVWALYDPDKLYRSTDGGTSWELRSMPKQWGLHPVITFIDDQQGWWLAPGNPTGKCQEAEAVIWHTIDGGVTWQPLRGAGIASKQCKTFIWFADSRRGFVGAWDDAHAATIYRTADGGDTWAAAQLLPDPPNYQSAGGGAGFQVSWTKAFGPTSYLGAIGTPYIYRSTDGGASWKWFTKVPSPAMVMVTETRWLDLVAPGQALESVNGGQQFHQFASNLGAMEPSSTQLVFASSSVGYAASPGHLARTANGGGDWKQLPPPGLGIAKPSPTPTPTPEATPPAPDVRLSAPSPEVVWALVGGEKLFRSPDQGATWEEKALPAAHPFSDLSFVDESDGWVLVSGPGATQCSFGGATVWRTTNAGANWSIVSQVNPPPASGARSGAGSMALDQCKENLSFIDKQRGFLAAWDPNSAPSIYRTSDGGVTWSRSRLPDPPGFRTFGGGDALRAGVVRSIGSTLLVEANGMQPEGARSYVFESADGGATWDFAAAAPTTSENNVGFATATRWLRVGNDGSGQETIDAGNTWHSFTSDYSGDPNVPSFFVFVDGSLGYGTVNGVVRRTNSDGSHWVLINVSWR